ncbi:MAG: hypothetical protein VB913_11150 [Rhodospirillales bacterium]
MNTTTKLVSLIGLSVAVVAIAVYVMFNSLGTAIGTADADTQTRKLCRMDITQSFSP